MRRAPYSYATSFPLEEVHLELADGEQLHLIFKDLAWSRLHDAARGSKPAFLHEPRRTIDTQRALLDPLGIGPRCVAAVGDESAERWWLFVEKVDGVELWQVGDLAIWHDVARWLARFHAEHLDRADDALRASPHLLRHGARSYRFWADRAAAALHRRREPTARELLGALERHDLVVDALEQSSSTFVHGELYPSNVLVGAGHIWPVDWEMAGIGPPALDLAALSSGFGPEVRRSLITAYGDALPAISLDVLARQVDLCRFQLALQWLSWSDGWEPPSEHARDWVGEARDAAADLGL